MPLFSPYAVQLCLMKQFSQNIFKKGIKLTDFFPSHRIDGDDSARSHPVAAGRRESPSSSHVRQPPSQLHQQLQAHPGGERAGGAVGRGRQAEPVHLLGRVHPEQVPRGGGAAILHHPVRAHARKYLI